MKNLALIIICSHLLACNNGNNSEIQGNWITKSCDIATESFGPHQGKYAKSIYFFTSVNTINSSIQFYTGASCDVETEKLDFGESDNKITYLDSGLITLQEGIEGHRIELILPLADGPFIIEGSYTLTTGELCFSDNLNFNALDFIGYEAESDAIDFEKCLVIKQP